MKQLIALSLFFGFPALALAADLPNLVNGNNAHNQQMCIQRAASDCISTVCTTSSELNCSDNCQKAAEDKCKEQTE